MPNLKKRKRMGRMVSSISSALATLGFFVAVVHGPAADDSAASAPSALVALETTPTDPFGSSVTFVNNLTAVPAASVASSSAAAPAASTTTSASSSASSTASSTSPLRLRTRAS